MILPGLLRWCCCYRRKPNGKLRIYIDPKDLNKAIYREHLVLPTLEKILPKLSGLRYFSIVEGRCGYLNVELYKKTSVLTTFTFLYGRYRSLRIPFGFKMSQDVLQVKIYQTFEGCEGTLKIIADDIVIFGKAERNSSTIIVFMICRLDVELLH